MGRYTEQEMLALLAVDREASPAHALRRLDTGFDPDPDDDALPASVVQGGRSYETLPVRLKRVPIKDAVEGSPTHQFFLVVSRISESGTTHKVAMHPTRIPVTAASVREMLNGTQDMPQGVSRSVLKTALPILSRCESEPHANRLRDYDKHKIRLAAFSD